MYINPDVARWVLFLSVFCNIFCFYVFIWPRNASMYSYIFSKLSTLYTCSSIYMIGKDLRPNIINNFFFSLFSVFFWNGICSAFSLRLWIKIVEVMYAYNYFRLWIFYLRIFAMKHRYVSFDCNVFFFISLIADV